MAIRRKNGKRESGSAMIEAVGAIIVLFMAFYAVLQIYPWLNARSLCRYGAFYGAKGMALGYQPKFALRSVRVATVSASGKSIGNRAITEEKDASDYLVNGDASGIAYQYWHLQNNNDTLLEVSGSQSPTDEAECRVTLRKLPLIDEFLSKLFGITGNPEPESCVRSRNYSQIYLEGN